MQGPEGSLQAYSPTYVRAADFLYGCREPDSISGDPRLLEYREQLPEVGRQTALRVAVSMLDHPGLAVETALRDLDFSVQVLDDVSPARRRRDADLDAGAAFEAVSVPRADTTWEQREATFLRLHRGVAANFRPEVAGDSIRQATGLYEKVMDSALSDQVVDVLAGLVTRLDPQDWELAVNTVARASADRERWPVLYLQLRELAAPQPVNQTVQALRHLATPRLEILEDPEGIWLGSVLLPRED